MEKSDIVLFRNKSVSISPLSQYSSSFILHYWGHLHENRVFFLYILGVHLPLLIIPSLPTPSEVIIFWLHYICSHPTAGSLLIKILKLSRGNDRSACGEEALRKACSWQKGCWGPDCVTASQLRSCLATGISVKVQWIQSTFSHRWCQSKSWKKYFCREVLFAAKCSVIRVAYPADFCKLELN